MITYKCPKCGTVSERSTCGQCGERTNAESRLYWCPNCNIPLYDIHCECCGGNAIEFAADVRPVFPEERLLIEILTGEPFAYANSSVWASSGDRIMLMGRGSHSQLLSTAMQMLTRYDSSGIGWHRKTVMRRLISILIVLFKQTKRGYTLSKPRLFTVSATKDQCEFFDKLKEIVNWQGEERIDVTGKIDLALEDEDGTWRIIDYKTDHMLPVDNGSKTAFHERLNRQYSSQLELYKIVLQYLAGKEVKEACLLSV